MKSASTHLRLSLFALAALAFSGPAALAQSAAAPNPSTGTSASPTAFTPAPADTIPDNEFGEMVKKGQRIFLHTGEYASDYVGNSLNCVSCHLDAGRRKNASPMWAAYVLYPAYRSKNKHVNTLAERLQGCFQYSMNGKAPPADSETIVALQSYMYWMAKGAPTGVKLDGQGYPRLPEPPQKPDYVRGQQVFEQNCALCHGANGEGQHVNGKMVFPALWGDDSFNWGAGMHSVATAAAFIKANMPLGKGGTLSDQQAWDVAQYMDSHDRPQDPRFKGSLEETRQQHHGGEHDMYGTTVNGKMLGADSTPSGGKLSGQKQSEAS
ncbi:c-type cytochrome [Allopusillimonas soli]|uniref:C-type cytochrome n=1 Tax=Allopusillimonas soli TaxID=659016 RepID=A0A853FCM1_9BURK|nr:c-type cytochrome [Allopusillimonas soli]NYT37498.1 c-type cytochrome [Allopusillimonas soli]TEA74525.1 c-type cytochrome [Allopusillimonas soli]